MQRNCNQSCRQATIFVIKGKAKPGHDRGRGQWKATSFLHGYVSELWACASDEVRSLCEAHTCGHTCAHLRADRDWRVSSNMADRGLQSGMASGQLTDWRGVKHDHHPYIHGMQKWSLPWPSRTSPGWERPEFKWKAKQEETNFHPFTCLFTKQSSPLLHLSRDRCRASESLPSPRN